MNPYEKDRLGAAPEPVGGREQVVAAGVEVDHVADLPRPDGLKGLNVAGIETEAVAHQQLHPRPLGRPGDRLGVLQRSCQWFLDQQVHPPGGQFLGRLAVQLIGRCDHGSIEIVHRGEQLVDGAEGRDPVRLAQASGGLVVDVDQRDQLGVSQVGQDLQVAAAHVATRADDGCSNSHLLPLLVAASIAPR